MIGLVAIGFEGADFGSSFLTCSFRVFFSVFIVFLNGGAMSQAM